MSTCRAEARLFSMLRLFIACVAGASALHVVDERRVLLLGCSLDRNALLAFCDGHGDQTDSPVQTAWCFNEELKARVGYIFHPGVGLHGDLHHPIALARGLSTGAILEGHANETSLRMLRASPHLVVVDSSLWDLAVWKHGTRRGGGENTTPVAKGVPAAHVPRWCQHDLPNLLERVSQIFPTSRIAFRTAPTIDHTNQYDEFEKHDIELLYTCITSSMINGMLFGKYEIIDYHAIMEKLIDRKTTYHNMSDLFRADGYHPGWYPSALYFNEILRRVGLNPQDPPEPQLKATASQYSRQADRKAKFEVVIQGDPNDLDPIPDEVKVASGEVLLHEMKALCPVMQLGAWNAQKFYYNDTDDGLGSRILDFIGALSYAEKMDLRFAGVILQTRAQATSHHVNITFGLKSFFGCADTPEMYVDAPPPGTQRFRTVRDLNLQLEAGEMDPTVPVQVEKGRDLADQVVSPKILAALRFLRSGGFSEIGGTPIMKMPLVRFHPSDFNVAVHVRRGDVEPSARFRFTPAEYYLWLMKVMRSKVPHARFHVFSETGKRDDYSKEFDQYRKLGATVHLDTEALEALEHMAGADVLVTAHSSFSYVAALFNPNCVLDQRWKEPQREWVQLPKQRPENGERGAISEQIGSCMTSIVARKSAQHG